MLTLRPASARGRFDHGWLDTRHTFSFASYHDLDHMGFRSLRVMNEDRVAPAKGFGTHGHKDMEIVSYVLDGELEHKDSLGHGAILRPGEFQRITAGTGIQHSEFNPSKTTPAHFYQIWLEPERAGLKPGYEQKRFPVEERQGRLRVVASPDGRDGSLTIHQDATISLALLGKGEVVRHSIEPGRGAWLQVLRGTVKLNGLSVSEGDGVAAERESALEVVAGTDAEILLFDLK